MAQLALAPMVCLPARLAEVEATVALAVPEAMASAVLLMVTVVPGALADVAALVTVVQTAQPVTVVAQAALALPAVLAVPRRRSSTICPSLRRTIRLARSATSGSCVISTTVRRSSFRREKIRSTSVVERESRLPVGSSARRTAG